MRPWGWIIVANLFIYGDIAALVKVLQREGDGHWLIDTWRSVGSNIEMLIRSFL